MLTKVSWPVVALVAIAAAALVTLSVTHILPSTIVVGAVSGLVGWLLPSPATSKVQP